jgi:hypothetical protein
MAVDKTLEPFEVETEGNPEESELKVSVVNPDAVAIETEDGGVVVDFEGGATEETGDIDHNGNLAEHIEEPDLDEMASDLIEDFESDRISRKEWSRSYMKGLDLLGMKIEERTQPWEGASGVFHPLLSEAVVRFQAQAMGEIFPASGPVRTKVVGKATKEKTSQSKRVESEMNYMLTEEMTEYRDEMEQMLFRLPLAGSAFKKVYYDPIMERPCSMFVPAEDFVVSYGASDLMSCSRYTHIMKKTENQIKELMVNGFYSDIDLPEPHQDQSEIQEKYDEMEGSEATVYDEDDRYTILEMHVDLEMPEPFEDKDGLARPYIVTLDKSSKTILSIRRNWYENDEKKTKRQHFVHYRYLPSLGFYGTGLIHLIGGLAKSATSILRQLIDAGTLSNLPAGLKARGLRIKGDDSPLMPGEFRDVDVPGGAIRDSITFIPYKEPSSVLYQLLGNIVDEGRKIGSIADVQIGNMNPNAPVGTTLALMERSMKVMSGVQSRLHAALKKELRILAKCIHDFMPSQYLYETEGEFSRTKDFDERVDVIPVSDPNASTMAQRVTQYQSALQLAQQAPQLYDMGKLHRQMLEVLGIQDAEKIIKLPEDIAPKDPVTENMAMMKQEPVKAFKYQDHEAHIAVHTAAAQDPKIQQIIGQSPFASAIQNALAAHITEHVAFQYRKEIEERLGVPMPSEDEPLPDDVEEQLSKLTAQAASQVLTESQAEMAQQEAQKQAEDPLTIMQQREMALKEAEFEHKKQMDMAKIELDAQQKQKDQEIEVTKVATNAILDEAKAKREEKRKGFQEGVNLAREFVDGE